MIKINMSTLAFIFAPKSLDTIHCKCLFQVLLAFGAFYTLAYITHFGLKDTL